MNDRQSEGIDVLKRVADLAFAWSLIITLLPGVFVIDVLPSQTAAVFTSYALVALAIAAKFWRRTSSWIVTAVVAYTGLVVLGWLSWGASLGSSRSLDFWQAWVLSAALLLFGLAFAQSNVSSWRDILIWSGVSVAMVQDLSLGTSRDLLAQKLSTAGAAEFYCARPIGASVAMLMLVAFAAALYKPLPAPWGWLVPSFLGINVVLSQHRSVWVATAVLCVLILLNLRHLPQARQALVSILISAGFLSASLLSPLLGVSLLPTSRISSAGGSGGGLPDVISSSSSLAWRLEMWESRLTASRSPLEWLSGGSFGVTSVRVPGQGVMNPSLSAHSQYVDLVTMLGLIGLLVAMGLMVTAIVASRLPLPWVSATLCAVTAYGIFYSWPVWSWVLVGVGLAARGLPIPKSETRLATRGESEFLPQSH